MMASSLFAPWAVGRSQKSPVDWRRNQSLFLSSELGWGGKPPVVGWFLYHIDPEKSVAFLLGSLFRGLGQRHAPPIQSNSTIHALLLTTSLPRLRQTPLRGPETRAPAEGDTPSRVPDDTMPGSVRV